MQPPSFLASSLLVALGGAGGAWARYVFGRATSCLIGPVRASAFPWATLGVNVLGCIAMGLLAGWLAHRGDGGETWRLLLGTGVLGGFTTFSAFGLEFTHLAERGDIALAAGYVALSLAACLGGVFAGLALMRTWG